MTGRAGSGAALAAAALLLAACAGTAPPAAVATGPSPGSAAVAPIPQAPGRGALVLHGGGEDAAGFAERVAALAGAGRHLCVIDTADDEGGDSRAMFAHLAGLTLTRLAPAAADAASPAVVAALEGCTGFYFGGGAPQRLSDTFLTPAGDSPALAVIRRKFQREGAVVSGASAGAMILGPVTLCECGPQSSLAAVQAGQLTQAAGFGFLDGTLIDAHALARGLIGRELVAMERNALPRVLAIDEGTAVVVPPDPAAPWEVIGGRWAALLTRNGPEGATLDLLAPGDRFHPAERHFDLAPGADAPPGAAAETGKAPADAVAPYAAVALAGTVALTGKPASAAIGGGPARLAFAPGPGMRFRGRGGEPFSLLGALVRIER
ncbi:MAG TPA: Type 1 glutamine amidotransferase-like domain-containing protein [Alphaproteobacteria bacterium]|nr:Type 1 glutamine amidotransferase-like domain-containing protein [Alphaproteobacteria bacterium]